MINNKRFSNRLKHLLSLAILFTLSSVTPASEDNTASAFDRKTALDTSQSAIGKQLSDHHFTDTQGRPVKLSDYYDKPMVISLIYTSCFHICPTTTLNLNKVVKKARDVLGKDSFNVLTIGFDTKNDTADAMRMFAKHRHVDRHRWAFLSTSEETINKLSAELGFLFFPSPHGFDHLVQSTVVDNEQKVYRQVYGVTFATPHLIEPLKELVFGQPQNESLLSEISNKIRLFCTVYDPANDRYRFDYSIFVGLFVGFTIGGVFIYIVTREWRKKKAANRQMVEHID